MRFDEIRGKGVPDGMRMWGAVVKPYQFVIVYDKEDPKKFICCWKHRDHAEKDSCHLDSSYSSFDAAKAACEEVHAQLKRKN